MPGNDSQVPELVMESTQDEPPDLIEVGLSENEMAPDTLQSQVEDLSISKVPLTIVTGTDPVRTESASRVI